jgi:hypothetical protein
MPEKFNIHWRKLSIWLGNDLSLFFVMKNAVEMRITANSGLDLNFPSLVKLNHPNFDFTLHRPAIQSGRIPKDD